MAGPVRLGEAVEHSHRWPPIGSPLSAVEGPRGHVADVAFSPDGAPLGTAALKLIT